MVKGGMHGEGGMRGERGACVAKGRGHAWDTTRYGDTINERAVRILLECILVFSFCSVPASNSNIISGGSTIDRPDGEENSQKTPEQNLGILYFASHVNSLFHCKLITLQPRLHYKICETLTF